MYVLIVLALVRRATSRVDANFRLPAPAMMSSESEKSKTKKFTTSQGDFRHLLSHYSEQSKV